MPINAFDPLNTKIGLPEEKQTTDLESVTNAMRKDGAEAAAKTDLTGTGIMAGAQLAAGLGQGLFQSAMAEQKAKQEALAQQSAAQQQAMAQAGATGHGALAQLISAYRGSLK